MAGARGAREHADRHARLAADMAATQARLESTTAQGAVLESAIAEARHTRPPANRSGLL